MSAASTLRIEIRPSASLAGALALVHVLALAAAWFSLSGWPRHLVAFGVLLSGTACLAEVLQRSVRAALSLEVHSDGRALWRDRRGGWHEGRLGRHHYVSPALVVVELRPAEGGLKRVVLLADSAPPEDLRRLRVRLRWHGENGPGASAAAQDRNNPTAG